MRAAVRAQEQVHKTAPPVPVAFTMIITDNSAYQAANRDIFPILSP